MEIFELIFTENGIEEITLLESEPIGYDGLDFNLQKENGRYGIDTIFAGQEIKIKFTEHRFPIEYAKLEDYYNRFGFEADVKLRITINEHVFIGNLDFLTCEYNGYDSFEFSVVQDTNEALLKKRADIGVKLTDPKNLDGEFDFASIPPIKMMYLPSKINSVESVYENPKQRVFASPGYGVFCFNPFQNTTKFQISDTLSFLDPFVYAPSNNNFQVHRNFRIINAKKDYTNVKIKIEFGGQSVISHSSAIILKLHIVKAIDTDNIQDFVNNASGGYTFDLINSNQGGEYYLPDLEFDFNAHFQNSDLLSGESVYMYYEISALALVLFGKAKMTITADEKNFDIVAPVISLHDAIKKVVKSSSGLDIDFPMANNGTLRNTYITNKNYIRGFSNHIDNFILSFEDIEKWLPELNLDYQIQTNGKVFIGHFENFYKNNEIEVFSNVAFDTYSVMQNERFALNKFEYKYDNYYTGEADDKNNEVVHGQAEYHILNKQVENVKSVNVNFIRDPFLLQDVIDDALKYNESRQQDNDTNVYIIDAVPINNNDRQITKTAVFYHKKVDDNTLELTSIDFYFDMLGMAVGSTFEILGIKNIGTYLITAIGANIITLQKQNATLNYSGESFTKFVYRLRDNVTIKPRYYSQAYNNMFGVTGIKNPQRFANLAYSVRRNINYYLSFLSTALINQNNAELINYKTNKKYVNHAYLPPHFEDSAITRVMPILGRNIVNTTLIMPFENYLRLATTLRTQNNGFIRTFNPKGDAVYLYPKEMKCTVKSAYLREVNIVGEEKYMPNEINITKVGNAYKIFVHTLNNMSYEVLENGYFQFYDDNNIKIYKKIHFSNVKVSGFSFGSADALNAYLLNY